jgi:hypothetical protein
MLIYLLELFDGGAEAPPPYIEWCHFIEYMSSLCDNDYCNYPIEPEIKELGLYNGLRQYLILIGILTIHS